MSASLSSLLAPPGFEEGFEPAGFDISAFAAHALSSSRNLAAIIDQTSLNPAVQSKDVFELCEHARRYRFASVVVNSCWIPLAHDLLAGTGIPVGSVIDFPFGASLTRTKLEQADIALRLGARELDMVLNIGALKSRNNHTVQTDVQAVVTLAHAAGATVKIILETCLLTLEEKLRASEICVATGVDFLKTSTGFSTAGATAQDVSLLRGVAGGHCGVKASGGIRTFATAREMLEAGASRIGTSSGPAILEQYLEQNPGPEKSAAQASLVDAE